MAHLPYETSYAWGAYLGYGINSENLIPPLLAKVPVLGSKLLANKWIKEIAARDVKLVLAEYGPVGVHWLPVCQKAGIPLLVYFHGFDVTRGNIVARYKPRYKELFQYASTLLVVSQPMRQLLLDWGAPQDKIVLNPCGADLEQFHYMERTHTDPILLSLGRFASTKRPDLTILAFSEVLKEVPGATLHMIGAGEMLAECKQLVQDKGLGNKVQFLGVLSPSQVAQEMQLASVFIQHSATTASGETEGAPVAIMEAGAMGLPVVSTLHAGIPEIVVHGQTGYLVHEGDVQGMANYCVELLANPAKAKQMGRAAAERIAQHFSLERNIRILTDTINPYL